MGVCEIGNLLSVSQSEVIRGGDKQTLSQATISHSFYYQTLATFVAGLAKVHQPLIQVPVTPIPKQGGWMT